jgi:hypothetical protein
MVIFRWLSLVLVAMAVMLLGADVVGTLEKKTVVIRSLNEIILLFNYNSKQEMIANFPPQVLNLAVTITDWPGWLLFAFFGFAFALIAPSSRQVRPLPPPPPIPR